MSDLLDYVDPMDIPNLNEQQLYEYIKNDLGVPLGRNTIKRAVISREIKPTVIARKNLFSRADGLNWLREQTAKTQQPQPTRKKPKRKNSVPKVVAAHWSSTNETFTHCVACSQRLDPGSPYALCRFCRDYKPPKQQKTG